MGRRSAVETYLRELARELDCTWLERRRIVAEVRAHLTDALEAEMQAMPNRIAAEHRALARFGSAPEVGGGFASGQPISGRRGLRVGLITAGATCAALGVALLLFGGQSATPPTGGPIALGRGPIAWGPATVPVVCAAEAAGLPQLGRHAAGSASARAAATRLGPLQVRDAVVATPELSALAPTAPPMLGAASEYLGMSEGELGSHLASGRTLAALAGAAHRSIAGLEAVIVRAATGQLKGRLDPGVRAKLVSPAQEARALGQQRRRLRRLLSRVIAESHPGRRSAPSCGRLALGLLIPSRSDRRPSPQL